MGMGGGGSPDAEIFEINVTPLVDVCLVLVIIMMVTAPIMSQPKLLIDLPAAANADKGEEKSKLSINIDGEGKVAINEREVKWENLESELTAKVLDALDEDKVVLIRADEKATYKSIVEAMNIAKKADARKVTIATEPVDVDQKKKDTKKAEEEKKAKEKKG